MNIQHFIRKMNNTIQKILYSTNIDETTGSLEEKRINWKSKTKIKCELVTSVCCKDLNGLNM